MNVTKTSVRPRGDHSTRSSFFTPYQNSSLKTLERYANARATNYVEIRKPLNMGRNSWCPQVKEQSVLEPRTRHSQQLILLICLQKRKSPSPMPRSRRALKSGRHGGCAVAATPTRTTSIQAKRTHTVVLTRWYVNNRRFTSDLRSSRSAHRPEYRSRSRVLLL